ncbi:hypothetical protein TrRE_jg7066 [Triparma retinervis]|uniref:Uncharacterized protein n=1 Tax=Triparma retinervis TaxID=2557542 RepID=A0A9W6Z6H8_9STRA|nr:hypothetical protein TrRE_jg7066 [Triparma retinervis]
MEEGDNFTITQEANRMIGTLIEAEVKRIVGLVKDRGEIQQATKKRKKKLSLDLDPVLTPSVESKTTKRPRRRRITLADIQEVAGEWNPNVGVYAEAIEATAALVKEQDTKPPVDVEGVKRLQERVSNGKAREGDQERMEEVAREQEALLGESAERMGMGGGYVVGKEEEEWGKEGGDGVFM